jgi:hypothetical protein
LWGLPHRALGRRGPARDAAAGPDCITDTAGLLSREHCARHYLPRPAPYTSRARRQQPGEAVALAYNFARVHQIDARPTLAFGSPVNAFLAAGSRPGERNAQHSGYWLSVYTPLAFIANERAKAKEYRAFGPLEVTEEMRQPVLTVIIHPDSPAAFHAFASSVEHVVIGSTAKEAVALQPLRKETFGEEFQNAMGAKIDLSGVIATFPLDAIDAIRAADPNREFFVTVVGSGSKKDFKVKTKGAAAEVSRF